MWVANSTHVFTEVRDSMRLVITESHTHTHKPLASLFTHKPQSPRVSKPEVGYLYSQRHRAFLTHHWAIATLYSAENPVPALSISGPAAKKPTAANRKIWLCVADRIFIIAGGWGGVRWGWLWGNCRLFVRARQCCVCLLLRSPASWLSLHCHRIMDSLACWEKINCSFLCFAPP